MKNYSLTFVYNIYIKVKKSLHPQGDSVDTKCPQAAQRKQAKRACT